MTTANLAPQSPAFDTGFGRLVPGIVLVALVTSAAYGIRQIPMLGNFSPMISAIFLGMLLANFVLVPKNALPGISVVGKRVLRLAVALLGFQLTLAQTFEVGLAGMAALAAIVASTYVFVLACGRMLGVDMSLARLIGAGTAICGASAVAAADSLQKGPDEDVAYAVACVTVFGTISMLVYPMLASWLGLSDLAFGFWVGSSVHEVAQVVATGFQFGTEAGEASVMVKLSRVLLLAPLLLTMSVLCGRRSDRSGASMSLTQVFPVFVMGFIAAMLCSSFDLVPAAMREALAKITPIMLTAALGALGLGTTFHSIRMRGFRPFVLAALATVFIATAGLLASGVLT